MRSPESWPIPYIPDPQNLAVDAFVAFCVAVLFAVLVNREGQAFAATLLGDRRPGAKDRLHFIAFLHLDVLGTLCFLVGGFGWAKPLDIDSSKFVRPQLYTLAARLAGPFANILLANIAASIIAIMQSLGAPARVFEMILGVNVTMAVYNVLPLPPLAAGAVLAQALPRQLGWLLERAGPFALLGLALLDRLNPPGFISPYLHPVVKAGCRYILGH
jgi:Zn-dependent protease